MCFLERGRRMNKVSDVSGSAPEPSPMSQAHASAPVLRQQSASGDSVSVKSCAMSEHTPEKNNNNNINNNNINNSQIPRILRTAPDDAESSAQVS